MYEYLKPLFGTAEDGSPLALTFEQLSTALSENKDIKLVNLADGGYVSKDKFDGKETELKGIKEQLDNANNTIKSYKDMDIDGIKQSVTDWEKKYNDDTAALRQQLAEQEQMHSLDMFLSGYQFTSKAAKDGIRAEFLSKKFPFENGSFLGAKEYMDGLKSNDDYKGAFVTEVVPPTAPDPVPPAPKPQFSDPNPIKPQPKAKISLAELMRKKNENPSMKVTFD